MVRKYGHRFSNTRRTRDRVADIGKLKFNSWESIPLHVRLLLLEHISLIVQEVLRGKG